MITQRQYVSANGADDVGFDPLATAFARCEYAELSMGFVMVTPEMAESWLERNVHNRKLSPNLVKLFTGDMAEDRWRFEGEPVRFDVHLHLIDGQHRLEAIVRSGKGQLMLVLVGLPSESQMVTDAGRKRSAADIFALLGKEHSTQIAAVTRLVIQWKEGQIRTAGSHAADATSTVHQVEVEESDPYIAWAVASASRFTGARHLMPAAVGFFLWLLAETDPMGAIEYIESLANYATSGADDPRLTVIKKLTQRLTYESDEANPIELTGKGRPGRIATIFILIRGWNAWVNGERLRLIKLQVNGKPSPMPQIEPRRKPSVGGRQFINVPPAV